MLVSSGIAHAEVPPRTAEASSVLVEMGGWQIFAAEMSVDGLYISFKDVEATAQGPTKWTLSADRLDAARAPSGTRFADIVWMRVRGDVRLSGADDLYVTAEQAVSVQPRRTLQFIDAGLPPTAGAEKWRLAARRITVQLASGRVEYDRPVSGPLRAARARSGGITRPYARNITGAPSSELVKDREARTKNQEHPRDGQIAFRLTGVETIRHLNQE